MFRVLSFFSLLVSMTFLCASCVDNTTRQSLEEIRFLLDDNLYTEAIDQARELVAEEPNNAEARYLLGTSLFSSAALSGGLGCDESDTGALGLVACLLQDADGGESDIETFKRIAPSIEDIPNLQEGREILAALGAEIAPGEAFEGETFLNLYLSRLFEIASALTITGVLSDNEVCNADPGNALKDLVPDEFDADALTAADAAQFDENLANINADGARANLPSSFDLTSRLDDIRADLELFADAQTFLEDQFAGAAKITCTETK